MERKIIKKSKREINKKYKRGIYFTLDALFATILIGLALILSSKYFITDIKQPQIIYYSQDIINCLSNIKTSEVNDTYINSLILSGEIINPNNTVIEQIGEFYVLNQTEKATNLSATLSQRLIPEKYGIEILVANNRIYYNESEQDAVKELIASRRLISGIEENKPLKGATSKVFLEGIKNKKFSSYLYFGGFIGQGNITTNLTGIPTDADILNIEIEVDAGDDFDLFINDNFCDSFIITSGQTIAERWNISSCKDKIVTGNNKFDIYFNKNISKSYIAGGFIKVDYHTQELSGYFEGHKIKYHFPGIKGITNLFDAFYVPGTITSMELFMHFKANETSYLTVGNKVIHQWPGSEFEQDYLILNSSLGTSFYSDLASEFELFSNNTVPIRFASYEDITYQITGGSADVVLITDISGSMKKSVEDWSLAASAADCNDPALYTDAKTRRARAAICMDYLFTDIVMNYTGNRLWPIYIRDDSIINYTSSPSSKSLVEQSLDAWYNDQGKGKTCLACAINQAYDLLNHYSNSSRNKFIVLMTDGCPTHCAQGSCTSTSFIYGVKQCEGLCDVPGGCGDIDAECTECTNNDGAADNTLYSAQRARDDLNVTIYTIGFGPVDDCLLANGTLAQVAEIGNGTYQYSKNISELKLIYQNISYEILEVAKQYAQVVSIKEIGNITESTLYSDSYIEVEYIPIAEQPAFDEIAVAIEEPKFTSCTPSFNIPTGLRVTDAKVTSYSGEHWTEAVNINNNNVYNLSNFLLDYVKLGDPFFVYVPINNIIEGDNTLFIETADTPINKTGCSYNDTIIYTGLIKSSISYADVLPNSEGCTWELEFEDGTISNIKVPKTYSGTKICNYATATYDRNDSIDSAAYLLFYSLDYDHDGKIYVNIDQYNLAVNAISVRMIPYPWGPVVAEVRIWK